MLESAKTVFAVSFIFGALVFCMGVPAAIKNRKTMSRKDFLYSVCVGSFFGIIALWSFYCYFAIPKGTHMQDAYDLIFSKWGK